jgi:hypothetical protein
MKKTTAANIPLIEPPPDGNRRLYWLTYCSLAGLLVLSAFWGITDLGMDVHDNEILRHHIAISKDLLSYLSLPAQQRNSPPADPCPNCLCG